MVADDGLVPSVSVVPLEAVEWKRMRSVRGESDARRSVSRML